MEYLLSQTGEPLAPLCPEEEEEFPEETEEDEDEDDDVNRNPTVVLEPVSPAPIVPPPVSPSPPLHDVSSASPPLISSSPPHLVPMEQPVEVELEHLEPPLLEQVQDKILATAAIVSRLSTLLSLC